MLFKVKKLIIFFNKIGVKNAFFYIRWRLYRKIFTYVADRSPEFMSDYFYFLALQQVDNCINKGKNIDLLRIKKRLKKLIKRYPYKPQAYFLLAQLQYKSCSLAAFKSFNYYQQLLYRENQKSALDRRMIEIIPDSILCGSLGNFWTLDSLIKANELGLRRKKILLALLKPDAKPSNKILLKYFLPYIQVVDSEKEIYRLLPIRNKLELPLGFILPLVDSAPFLEIGDAIIQKKWFEKAYHSLLKLTEADYEAGEQVLERLGVPKNAWYVCLHVREPGYRDGGAISENHRNANPLTYELAIEAILAAGGWVIRMGDPVSMTPLAKKERVIDYAHCSYKTEFMDVFLAATCKFFIGTSSGLYCVAQMFGIPVLLTNALPILNCVYTLSPNCMLLPRLLRDNKTRKLYTFQEMLNPPLSMLASQPAYEALAVEWVENTAEELAAAVSNMLDLIDNKNILSSGDEVRYQQFKSITKNCGKLYGNFDVEMNSRLAPSFLEKYEYLLN